MSKLIFVTTPVYPNDENLASGMFVHDLNKMLQDRGYKIVVIDVQDRSYNYWMKDNYSEVLFRKHEGIDIVTTKYRGFMTQRFPKSSFHRFQSKFNLAIEAATGRYGNPDIVISHFTVFSGIASTQYFSELQIPVVHFEHHSLFLKDNISPFFIEKLKYTIMQSKQFITVSNQLEERIRSISGLEKDSKIISIPNMVSVEYGYKTPPKTNEEFIFFAAGNLVSSKNIGTLIKSFINAFQPNDKVKLKIAGNGKLKSELEALIVDNKRQHQIELLGTQNKKNMVSLFEQSHVFSLLSLYETFGIVYREAMVVGRPVISYKNGGVMENWNDSLGVIIDSNDVDSVAKVLQDVKRNYSQFDTKKISDYALSLYSPDVVFEQVDAVLRNVLGD